MEHFGRYSFQTNRDGWRLKPHPEEEGKELPPATTQVLEEVIKCEIGNINLKHPEPVQIDDEITLPMKDKKITTLQESEPHVKQLRK